MSFSRGEAKSSEISLAGFVTCVTTAMFAEREL